MNGFKFFLLVLMLISSSITAISQNSKSDKKDVIMLANPSFEDTPHTGQNAGSSISGWYDCGKEMFPGETPPDIQPSPDPSSLFFSVTTRPYDGATYLGMVVRENDSWESVSQRLSKPLEPGNCYEFSLYLCKSETYMSQKASYGYDPNIYPFTTPIQLRIWGGKTFCSKMELLHSTALVRNTQWARYQVRLDPKQMVNYIMLEAFYETPTLFPYNGNILVDNISSIVEVNCKSEKPVKKEIAEAKPKPERPVVRKPAPPKADNGSSFSRLNSKDLRTGQTIRIDKLYFAADSSIINPKSFAAVDEIYEFLTENSTIIVEIGGHTNDIPNHEYCDRLSEARAKAVYDYLIQKGIQPERLKYKGYGKRLPVASNKTPDGRKRNQRVEVKILSLNG